MEGEVTCDKPNGGRINVLMTEKNFSTQALQGNCSSSIKGILWQFYKLVLKVPSGRDENDGIGHFAELGSSWPGEAKTWPKIALRVGGRAEKYCVRGRAPVPQHIA